MRCATASSTPTCIREISSSTQQGRIVAVDFGIMGRLGRKERRFLAEILFGFIRRDYLRVAEVHFEAGYVPHVHRVEDFAQAIRAIGEPIHSRTADQISMAKLLTLLFEITALFDMTTRIELVMLQKTMVVVEGVARKLDPQLDMWSTAEPVVGDWIAENLGPRGRIEDVARNVSSVGRFIAEAPRRLEEIAVCWMRARRQVGIALGANWRRADARRRCGRRALSLFSMCHLSGRHWGYRLRRWLRRAQMRGRLNMQLDTHRPPQIAGFGGE